jgi:hypothetical protein
MDKSLGKDSLTEMAGSLRQYVILLKMFPKVRVVINPALAEVAESIKNVVCAGI